MVASNAQAQGVKIGTKIGLVQKQNPYRCFNSVRGLTLQLLCELGDFLSVVIVGVGGAFQAEFLGFELVQSFHNLVF
jgi:hypothetical protein